ncbi:MAG: hypothetical protein ACFHVJ_13330 [Aestuariibacter sp.]
MTFLKLLLTYCSCFLLFCGDATAAKSRESILWATPIWPGFTDGPDKGYFDALMLSIFPSSEFKVVKQSTPWKRSLMMLKSARADMTGATDKSAELNQSHYPVLINQEAVVFKKSDIDWLGIESLRRHKGIWPPGYIDEFPQELRKALKGMDFEGREKAFQLFLHRPVPDYYLDSLYNIAWLTEKYISPQQKGQFQTEVIFTAELYWAFANSDKGNELKAYFDAQYVSLHCSGELQTLQRTFRIAAASTQIDCH